MPLHRSAAVLGNQLLNQQGWQQRRQEIYYFDEFAITLLI